MNNYECTCGETFPSLEELQEHWKTNNTATTGQAHYRVGIPYPADLAEANKYMREELKKYP
jgi:hypothetical protein